MRELFYFDIETCGEFPDFETFKNVDERGSILFEKKYNTYDWEDKYGSIDIAYINNAGIISTYGKIICISFGYINDGEYRISSLYGEDEEDILNEFNNLLRKIEKKSFNLSGFRIVHFDIPWILHKLHKYGIEPADIIYTYDKKPWDMRITDMSNDWKERSTFDEMCYGLGVDSPKDNIDGSDVHTKFWEGDLESIKIYCEKDIKASIECSLKIYKHLN